MPIRWLRESAASLLARVRTAASLSGSLVGTSDSQTLTNKTVALGSNTVSGTTAQFNTALTDGDFATLAGSETLSNKTLATPTITGRAHAQDSIRVGTGGDITGYMFFAAAASGDTPIGYRRATNADNVYFGVIPAGDASATNVHWSIGIFAGRSHLDFNTWDGGTSRTVLSVGCVSGVRLIGFLGVEPVARQVVGNAATDAATTQALANNLRTALINFGLCSAS